MLSFYEGDTPTFEVQFFQEDGVTPIDLSAATVYFYMVDSDGNVKVNRAMTIYDATKGIVRITLTTGETNWSGTGRAEFEARYTDGTILTLAQVPVEAKKQMRA